MVFFFFFYKARRVIDALSLKKINRKFDFALNYYYNFFDFQSVKLIWKLENIDLIFLNYIFAGKKRTEGRTYFFFFLHERPMFMAKYFTRKSGFA